LKIRNLLIILPLFISVAYAATLFTFRSPESNLDLRYDYDNQLLALALEKTKHEYGDFKLVPSPVMNFLRAENVAKTNQLENFFFKQSYNEELAKDLLFIPFPIDLGIVGYRVCFVSKSNSTKLAQINSLEDLKQLSHGQGAGWLDATLLRHHGFAVTEAANYEGLFRMVANNRFDLFCRGTNELLGEYNAHKDVPNLTYDTRIAIAYPIPRFFFTAKQNTASAARIHKGLITAYNDGSLQSLWLKYYKESIDFVNLGERKIFYLDNPMLNGLDTDYKQYFYNPFGE
jgi:hypothetical protein